MIDVLWGFQPACPPPSSLPLLPSTPESQWWPLPLPCSQSLAAPSFHLRQAGASSARTAVTATTALQAETRTCTTYSVSDSAPLPSCVATQSLSLSEPQLPCLRNGSSGIFGKSTCLWRPTSVRR